MSIRNPSKDLVRVQRTGPGTKYNFDYLQHLDYI